MKNRLKALLIGVIASFVVFINFWNITEKDLAIKVEEQRNIALERVSLYSERIESMIITGDNYAGFYEFFISHNNAGFIEEFDSFAERIVAIEEVVDDLIITEGSVIKAIYPYEGNEKAIGYDLMSDEARTEFVERAINEKVSVTQGPIQSVQGGLKIYIRKPIFANENGKEEFLGLISIGLDFSQLLDKVDLKVFKNGFYFALKAEKADGTEDYIWGRESIFDKDPVIKEIKIPGQEWQLAIYPRYGWVNEQGVLNSMPVYYYFITLIVLVFTYQLVLKYITKTKQAETDDLTGIMNKRAFVCSTDKFYKEDNQNTHALFVMDVNDFKLINDTYGHIVGDLVLIEVAKRVQRVIKNGDSFCRIGGDEFTLLIQDIKEEEELETFIESLKAEFDEPMFVRGYEIKVNISIGAAIYPMDGVSHLELYHIADRRMYENKRKSKELNTI